MIEVSGSVPLLTIRIQEAQKHKDLDPQHYFLECEKYNYIFIIISYYLVYLL
jgi:hypothetical protein